MQSIRFLGQQGEKEAKEKEEKGWLCRDNTRLKHDWGVKEHSNITFINIARSVSEPAVKLKQACGSMQQTKTSFGDSVLLSYQQLPNIITHLEL